MSKRSVVIPEGQWERIEAINQRNGQPKGFNSYWIREAIAEKLLREESQERSYAKADEKSSDYYGGLNSGIADCGFSDPLDLGELG